MWIARLLQLQAEEILLFYVQKWGKYRYHETPLCMQASFSGSTASEPF